ncbi:MULTISPECIES: sodium:solute symporter [unclassified Sphingobacterium]|uniref:sodium:solute symporter n=1 Tax=unclassified Sphingobacterium TaxID=2609468 RepID=UPI00104BA494|nr:MULTISPECIES: sodium:solute symporter [unclassified Sphingobacterium]MCS3554242.1 SSS family solute:Na+ symporter [Sphingobacterium sp. JUb21]TCR08075.1 SSS family solute:Na+ symporter [Sphingobacterium sp. JUb20]
MLGSLDLSIAIIYILLILAVGIWAGVSQKLENKGSASDYFLAGKSLKWPAIGLALFATNISTVHLVSLAQSGFDTGLLNGNFEWMAAFTLILLALFFVPFYLKSGVSTLPDFLERRYDKASREWLTMISIVSAIVIHIAFSMLAGGIVLKTLFGFDMYLSITVICIITGIYTILGGLRAVVITESIQTIVLLAGAFIISFAAYDKMGGWISMKDVLVDEGQLERLSMLRPHGDSSGMPWYAVILGYPILGIWYWCADQTIVQRVLGAKDENHGRVGALFCGFIKILPVFIFVLPGLFAYTLFKTGQLDLTSLGVDVAGNVNSKGIYTLMITQLLPSGLIGVLVAALLSGLMSQISGALNSISTMVSYDIYKQKRPQATDKQLITAGKISAVVAMAFSLALLPLLDKYESIFNGINDVIAHIAPPITCVFLLGIFWKKASAASSKWTLWIGSALGVIVFIANKLFPETWIGQVPFMVMAFYLFIICVLIQIIFSYRFPVQHTAESKELYWKNPLEPLKGKAWKGIGNYRVLSGLLLLIVVVLYGIFK